MKATFLLLHPDDNVAVATRTFARGTSGEIGATRLTCLEQIPFGHKVAVRAIAEGETILKYGSPIGRACTGIRAGEHVHIHNCESARGATAPTNRDAFDVSPPRVAESGQARAHMLHLSQLTGYRRTDGCVGVRNHLLVLSTVQCANGVVERIGRSVPGVVALPHAYGCSQLGLDLDQTTRILEAFAGHPNVGAALLVSLGCESVCATAMAERLCSRGKWAELLTIQDEGGTRKTYDRALGIVQKMLRELQSVNREPIELGELVVGVECGGSDAWSGITANPAVGAASDLVVAVGGTVILSEVTEFIGAEDVLAARAASEEVSRAILRAVHEREDAVRKDGMSLRVGQLASPENLAPGNVAGGLTTIEEKSLGAIAKGGTSPVREVLSYGQAPSQKGLVIMNTAGNDPESVTGMVAGGAQIVVFTTGRGSPTGCPIAPVIKVASNTPMYRRLQDDMDIDAGPLLDGEQLEELGARILEETADVANGKSTAAERGGHHVFAIERLAPKV